MLFVTLNQHWIFFIILWYGLAFGLLYKLGQIVCKIIAKKLHDTKHLTNSKKLRKQNFTAKNSKKHQKTSKKCNFFNTFSKNVLDFVIVLIASSVYFVINYFYNFGEIRLFSIGAFVLGLLIGIWIINWITKRIATFKTTKNLTDTKQCESN